MSGPALQPASRAARDWSRWRIVEPVAGLNEGLLVWLIAREGASERLLSGRPWCGVSLVEPQQLRAAACRVAANDDAQGHLETLLRLTSRQVEGVACVITLQLCSLAHPPCALLRLPSSNLLAHSLTQCPATSVVCCKSKCNCEVVLLCLMLAVYLRFA